MACELAPKEAPKGQDIATFAGGCFWGLELAYQRLPGVTHTSVGYTAGHDMEVNYQKVCSGKTGHAEAVQVYFDPQQISYEDLLNEFFQRVDPTTLNRQGNDMGTQYRSAIYYHNDAQKQAAEKAIQEVNEKLKSNLFRRVLGTKVVSELQPAGDYYLAENYHQHYLQKGGQDASKGASDRIRCYG
jgi:peptide-methionine (S)-S-oxide reductase